MRLSRRNIEVNLEINDDFTVRLKATGDSEDVEEVVKMVMDKTDQARLRRRFLKWAHPLVFTVAVLSILGMAAHFLNLWEFNVRFLVSMGTWTLGTILWIYFSIIRDVFGIKEGIHRPPKL